MKNPLGVPGTTPSPPPESEDAKRRLRSAANNRTSVTVHATATGWATAKRTSPRRPGSLSSRGDGRSEPAADAAHCRRRMVDGAIDRLTHRSGTVRIAWARTRRRTVSGRRIRFHPHAASTCEASSNRLDRASRTIRAPP